MLGFECANPYILNTPNYSAVDMMVTFCMGRSDLCWTDGVLVNAATSYKWLYSEDYLSDEFAFEEGTHIGLRLLKGKGTSSLTPGGSMQSHCYICYKWLANENP